MYKNIKNYMYKNIIFPNTNLQQQNTLFKNTLKNTKTHYHYETLIRICKKFYPDND